MAANAALALTLLHNLSPRHPGPGQARFNGARIAACFADLSLPGRGQILSWEPIIIVDAAHTPASLELLGQHLDTLGKGERCFLISTTRGKDLQALGRLLKSATRVVVTRVDPLRTMPAAELAAGLARHHPRLEITVIEDPETALANVRELLTGDQILCICGSVYLAGFALEHLRA